MGSAISSIVGGGAGAVGGLFANQKEGGTDTGNALLNRNNIAGLQQIQQSDINNTRGYEGNATQDLQGNGILGGLYGKGGTLDQTIGQQSQQANQPWALTDQDKSSYGQASGDIARQFGQSDQNLSQALSDRGMTNSGAAGAAFSGAQGNKMEQLGQLQTQIANNRQKMNMDRLGQTQSFLSNLGGQANQAINAEQDRGIGKASAYNKMTEQQYNMAGGLLGKYQDQQNTGLQQQQQTAHGSVLGNVTGGFAAGSMAGAAAGGGGGGQGAKVPQKTMMAGGGDNDINGSMFA